jgi:methylenetetrahydrofolate dehydrogenase (NADP+)/methenyltetrahydrofolate cyclohydrolase
MGMEGRDLRLDKTTSEEELLSLIATLNADEKIHGILVQLPLPSHIREGLIIAALDPKKDVDCFHPISIGKLFLGEPGFLPCTPQGILVLLNELKIPVSGSHTVVVGRSNIVGKPLALLLARREANATVTLCHTGTKDLPSHTRQADILIAAAGKAGLIRGDMIKKGAAVIDVGVNRVPVPPDATPAGKKGYRLTGDVVFEDAVEVAGWITPVPGGVGPMTIAMLMRNVVQAAEQNDA